MRMAPRLSNGYVMVTAGITSTILVAAIGFILWSYFSLGGVLPANGSAMTDLMSISCHLVEDEVQMQWATSKEEHSDYFLVERSADGVSFVPFAEIKASGYSQNIQSYFAIDKAYYPSTSYYRLKQVDYNGNYTYSQVIKVETTGGSSLVRVYPKKASSLVHIKGLAEVPTTVSMVNEEGTEVFRHRVKQRTAQVDVSQFAEGIYWVEIIRASRKEVHCVEIDR